MKSLLSNLLCASLLFFAIGCGKDGGGSSSGSNGNPYNQGNPYYQAPSVDTEAAMNNLRTWYNSTAEIPATIGPKNEIRKVLTYSPMTCTTKTYLGFIDINRCKQGEVNSQNVTRTVNVIQSNNKSANTMLAQALNPVSGATLRYATETYSAVHPNGRLFFLEYVKPNGHILQYKVDTGLNSAFNPVEIYDSEQAKGEQVINFFQLI